MYCRQESRFVTAGDVAHEEDGPGEMTTGPVEIEGMDVPGEMTTGPVEIEGMDVPGEMTTGPVEIEGMDLPGEMTTGGVVEVGGMDLPGITRTRSASRERFPFIRPREAGAGDHAKCGGGGL